MQFERSDALPRLLRWTPEPTPYAELEADFTALSAGGVERGTSPILVSHEDWETFGDDWELHGAPTLEEVESTIAEVEPRSAAAYWSDRERIRVDYEAFSQKKHLAAAEAAIVEAVADGALQREIEPLLAELTEYGRQVEQLRLVAHMRSALADLTRNDIDAAQGQLIDTDPERLRRATRFAPTTLVHILEFVGEPWALPAAFGFGGFNHCPPTDDQVLVLREWHRDFGARLVRIGAGCLGFFVARPPVTIMARRDLAFTHWLYADDGQGQAVRLAAHAGSDAWYFGWM